MLTRFLTNYIQRHTHPLNRLLHLFGVPLTFVVTTILVVESEPWWWAVSSFVGGYALQFLGHAIEGNDAGEVVLIKKWMGRPYREFAPGKDPQDPVAGDDAGEA
ncbi:MAG: DUF962 domain-containing protein [Planctomycetota bacterium]|nr:DUF962 domain-containing protein [Planctomycetota bacterium]MED5449296.1 DUF962 domain-containing protein [Planctomycetota bacterium]